MSEDVVQEKKSFLSDRYNLILVGILGLAFVIALRYFNINTALWWDEAEYLSIAKHWAFGVPYDVSYIRPAFFPTFVTVLYTFGATEIVIRFFMVIFSVLAVYLTYLVGKEIFDKRIALASAFILVVSYLNIFYVARILIDIMVTVLWLLAIYFFWKGYVKNGSKYYFWLMGVVMGFGASLKMPFVLIGAPFLVYVFFNEGFSFLKNKNLWMSVLFFFLAIMPYFIYFNISYGGIPFISTPSYGFGKDGFTPFYVNVMPTIFASMIPQISTSWIFQVLLLLFIAGFVYMAYNLIIGFDLIKKESFLKSYAFLIAWMAIPFFFFSMISMAEDRYLFMIYPAMFMVACLVLFKCYDFIKKSNKYAAVAFVLVILFLSAYTQISYGDRLTKAKASSYVQLKDAALWMKDRSSPNDIILNSGVPQNSYYSERNTTYFPNDINEFPQMIASYKPKFMVLSALEKSPDWTYGWPQEHPDIVVPVLAYYADEAKKQPILVVYEFVINSTS
jgi:4-amino-4-deoxy-L-arabinose transferase-like glycosyltransferase